MKFLTTWMRASLVIEFENAGAFTRRWAALSLPSLKFWVSLISRKIVLTLHTSFTFLFMRGGCRAREWIGKNI